MDTILGKDGKGAIATLMERKNYFMLRGKLDTGKQTVPFAYTVVKLLKRTKMPVRTITTDNGTKRIEYCIIRLREQRSAKTCYSLEE